MKYSKSLTALIIVGASVVAPIANAHDSGLQSIVSKMLSTALAVTVDEVQIQTTLAVANAAHHVSTETSEIATSIKVIELTPEQAKQQEFKRENAESNKSSKSE